MRLLKLAWRFTRRDLASGEVRVLLAARCSRVLRLDSGRLVA